jgi:dihydrofolate reductase
MAHVGKVKADISISLDGYAAGPNQGEEHPLGEGGEQLHDWAVPLAAFNELHGRKGGEVNESTPVMEAMFDNVGAVIMGRNMFGPIRGEWGDEEWKGWWGDDPPYHLPVFVLTHYERRPLEMKGGTTFHFITDGIEPALERALEAAGEQAVLISGGASTIRQYLAAGFVDELHLHVTPLVLGGGEPILQDVGDLRLEQVRVVEAPGVVHLSYRVAK